MIQGNLTGTFIDKILCIGITPDMPFIEWQKTYLFNLFLLLAIPTIPFFLVSNIIHERYGLVFLNSLQVLIYTTGLYTNYTRRFLFMRPVYIWMLTLIFVMAALIYKTGSEYLLLVLLLPAVIIFDYRWHYFLLAICSLSAFAYIKVGQQQSTNLAADMQRRATLNMCLALIFLAVFLQVFKKIYLSYSVRLENAFREMMEAKKEKERMLQTIVHDLRSPIGAIKSFSQYMIQEETDPDKIKNLELINTTSSQSLNFIKELLEIKSAEPIQLNLSDVDMILLIDRVVKIHQHSSNQKEQTLLTIFSEKHIHIRADSIKLERVIGNLLHNAIKFSHIGGVIEIDVSLTPGSELLIAIRDSGVGIPDKDKETLFTAFGIAKSKGTAGEKSFGLGLAICREIIEAHQGHLLAESTEGNGATFKVFLPAT